MSRRTCITAVFLVVALSLVVSSRAQSESSTTPDIRTFVLSICNRTNSTIQAILVHRSQYGEDAWILHGWYTVQPAKCMPVTGIPRGYFYYYAEEAEGAGLAWAGDARRVCVDTRKVERAIFPKERCLTGERNVGFRETQNFNETFELPLGPPPKR